MSGKKKKKKQKGICGIISKGPFSYILDGQKPALGLLRSAGIGVVSVENSPCSIILMAVSNCIMPEQQVTLAAGVAASPHWKGALAKVSGSEPCPDTGLAPGQWVKLGSGGQTDDL